MSVAESNATDMQRIAALTSFRWVRMSAIAQHPA